MASAVASTEQTEVVSRAPEDRGTEAGNNVPKKEPLTNRGGMPVLRLLQSLRGLSLLSVTGH